MADALTIETIRAHFARGGRLLVESYTSPLLLDARHATYIRAAGAGFRLGWPGRGSVYVFAGALRLVGQPIGPKPSAAQFAAAALALVREIERRDGEGNTIPEHVYHPIKVLLWRAGLLPITACTEG